MNILWRQLLYRIGDVIDFYILIIGKIEKITMAKHASKPNALESSP